MDQMELNEENIISVCQNLILRDTYACSPVYYLMTCRKGGQIYKLQENYIIAALHPNTDDCVLIFHLFDETNTTYQYDCSERLAKDILLKNPIENRIIKAYFIYKSSCLIREVIFKRISKCTELIK